MKRNPRSNKLAVREEEGRKEKLDRMLRADALFLFALLSFRSASSDLSDASPSSSRGEREREKKSIHRATLHYLPPCELELVATPEKRPAKEYFNCRLALFELSFFRSRGDARAHGGKRRGTRLDGIRVDKFNFKGSIIL